MSRHADPSDDSMFDSLPDDMDADLMAAKLKLMTGFLEGLRDKIERGAMSPQEAYASYKQSEFSSMPQLMGSRQQSDSEHKTSMEAALEYLDQLKAEVLGYESVSIEPGGHSKPGIERKFVTLGDNPEQAVLVKSESFHRSETWMLEKSRNQIEWQLSKISPNNDQKKYQFDAGSSFGDFSKKSMNKIELMDVSDNKMTFPHINFDVININKMVKSSRSVVDDQPSPSFNFSQGRDSKSQILYTQSATLFDQQKIENGLHASLVVSVDGGPDCNDEEVSIDHEMARCYVSDLFEEATSQVEIMYPCQPPALKHSQKLLDLKKAGTPETKRDSFMNIAGNLWEEMANIHYPFTEAEKKDLIMDIKKEKTEDKSHSLCISGDLAKVEELVNLFIIPTMPAPGSDNFKDSRFGVLNKSWPQTSINKEIQLKAPLSMKSQTGQELIKIDRNRSGEKELERYCLSCPNFVQLLMARTPFDSPDFFIEEHTWITLDDKNRDALMRQFDKFYMFLPLHHVSLTPARKINLSEVTNFDKAFFALMYFNSMIVQQIINTIEPCLSGNSLLPCIDSPLGWLGPCTISNLFPLDNQYQPLFMNQCRNHFLTGAKCIFSKLTAIKLGGWSWLEIATMEQCLEALQLGCWIKVQLNSSTERDYVQESSKRMIAFDDDGNIWVKGPQSNISKTINKWFLIDSHSTLGMIKPKAEISEVFIKSSSDIYSRRLLVQPAICPMCLEIGIKDSEDSEDLASSYIIQFEIELTSEESTGIYIVELNLNADTATPYRFYLLTKSKLKSQTLFVKWKSRMAVLLLSQNGVGNVKMKYCSKLDINYSYHQLGLLPRELSPTIKRRQGFISLAEAISKLGNQDLFDNEIKANINLKDGGYDVNFIS